MSILKIAAICFAALLALEANADVACPEKFNGNYRWVSAERGTFLTESVQISIKLEKACSSINMGIPTFVWVAQRKRLKIAEFLS